jgi:hypothetical protein
MPQLPHQGDGDSRSAKAGVATTRRWAATAFPAALWFLSTFFFFGDTGRWNDDWFCTLRDPASGDVTALAFTGQMHFWRPLYRVVVPALQTILWQHQWALHLIGALVHALVAWLIWRLLRELGLSRQAAAAGALLFLVFPAHYEAILWPTAMPTALATAIMLGLYLLMLRWARGGAGWWVAPVAAGATFAAASLNEQPAGAALALPLLYLYACSPGEPVRRAVSRAMLPTAAAWLAGLTYIALHLRFADPAPQTGNGSFVPPADAARHLGALATTIGEHLSLDAFGRGALLFGAQAAGPGLLVVWAIVLAAAGWAWARHYAATPPSRRPDARPTTPLAALAIGGVIFLCQWGAVAPMYYWINSRLFYAPMVGIAIIAGAAADLVARLIEQRPAVAGRARLAAGIALTPALALFALIMVGIQAAYRERARADLADVQTLRDAVPDPAPGAVFVPVRIAGQVFHTDSARFDHSFRGVFMSWWSGTPCIRFGYGRADVSAERGEWNLPGLRDADAHTLTGFEGATVPLDRAVTFEIDESGRLRLVTALRLERPGRAPEVIEIPQTSAATRAGRIPERIATIKLPR